MHPPAICSNCHLIFPAIDLDLTGAIVGLKDIGVRCPRCNSLAFVPDGLYDFSEAAKEVAKSLASRPKALREATALAENAALGKITPMRAVRAAKRISPETGNLFSKVYSVFKENRETIAILISIASILLVYQQNKSADEVQQQMNMILDRLVTIQEHNQLSASEDILRPMPRPFAFGQPEAGNNQPRQTPNRRANRKAAALARKRPK